MPSNLNKSKNIRCGICQKLKVFTDNPSIREFYIKKFNGICTCSEIVFFQFPLENIKHIRPSLDDYDLCKGTDYLEDTFSYFENISDNE